MKKYQQFINKITMCKAIMDCYTNKSWAQNGPQSQTIFNSILYLK